MIREPTGQLTALRRTGSGTRYPITDALGSVIALTDAAGTKTDTFYYDPYGADTGRTGTTGTTENPYRFAGEHRDPTGLYKIGQRYYTPELGRWTQPDPFRRTVNPLSPPDASPYIYAGNNPCNYTDPTGAASCAWQTFDLIVAAFATIGGGLATLAGIATAAPLAGSTVPLAIAGGATFVAGVYGLGRSAAGIRESGCIDVYHQG